MSQLSNLPLRREPLAEQVFELLRQAIINKDLEPGMAVSETELARWLKVSKTPMREALLKLRQLDLIQGEGRDLHVVAPSVEMITNAYELRFALESQTARLAATRAKSADCDRLMDLAEQALQSCENDDHVNFRTQDTNFHSVLAEYSYNPLLSAQAQNVIVLTDVLRRRDSPMTSVSLRCAHDHVALVEAIVKKDDGAARRIIEDHIDVVKTRILSDYTEFARIDETNPEATVR